MILDLDASGSVVLCRCGLSKEREDVWYRSQHKHAAEAWRSVRRCICSRRQAVHLNFAADWMGCSTNQKHRPGATVDTARQHQAAPSNGATRSNMEEHDAIWSHTAQHDEGAAHAVMMMSRKSSLRTLCVRITVGNRWSMLSLDW